MSLLPRIQVSLSAGLLLDRARAEDDARWPAAVARERQETRRTYAARCAVAMAQQVAEWAGPPGAGDEMAARWRTDP
ncbi:hypothetical protein AB0N21_24625 [Streptomyces sp. NPDC051080]|uniref:hypothetical protein n=1 Tax=Streptomyces sp. NPDC051080 TaxID=3157222 RepID=UPI003443F7C6